MAGLRLRFSLRTMMLAVLVVGFVFGAVFLRLRRNAHAEALTELEEALFEQEIILQSAEARYKNQAVLCGSGEEYLRALIRVERGRTPPDTGRLEELKEEIARGRAEEQAANVTYDAEKAKRDKLKKRLDAMR